MRLARGTVTAIVLVLAWQAVVSATGVPRFILPSPLAVARMLGDEAGLITEHALRTALEIVLGLALGIVFGVTSALSMSVLRPVRRWLLPMLVVSQAVPVFALAPLLVLWLGYGLASKVAVAALVIYFPVTSAFFDGLRRTDPGWLDLAHTMGGSRWAVLRHVRVPAALPAFASGVRVAAAVAPIGAVIGEWVGSSSGLGFLMLHANGRMQTDLMFAALFVLSAMAVALYFAVDAALRRLVSWQPITEPAEEGG
jgi:putative hydroxymethylpyrimidine transport system permease protein